MSSGLRFLRSGEDVLNGWRDEMEGRAMFSAALWRLLASSAVLWSNCEGIPLELVSGSYAAAGDAHGATEGHDGLDNEGVK